MATSNRHDELNREDAILDFFKKATHAMQYGKLDFFKNNPVLDKEINTPFHVRNRTLLHYACAMRTLRETGKQLELINLLIEKGADVNVFEHHGKSPLHSATERGYADVVDLLLSKGAIIQTIVTEKKEEKEVYETPTSIAVRKEHTNVIEKFMQHGLDINKPCHPNGLTPAAIAAQEDKIKMLSFLIEKGSNIDELAISAVRQGDEKILNALFLAGVDLNALKTKNGQSLGEVIKQANKPHIETLLEMHAAVREARTPSEKVAKLFETLATPTAKKFGMFGGSTPKAKYQEKARTIADEVSRHGEWRVDEIQKYIKKMSEDIPRTPSTDKFHTYSQFAQDVVLKEAESVTAKVQPSAPGS